MSDPDIKTYSRGGRLAFTAGIMQGHVGETWTLSFWIRLAEGSVEGHDVIVYPYQTSGTSIDGDNHREQHINVTSEWQLVEYTGIVKNFGVRDGSTYDGTSEFYRVNGVAYSYGEMWFYDRTASQKYEVYGVICAPADSGSGGGASMSTPARNLLHGALDLTGDVGTGTGTRSEGGTAGAAYSRTGCSRWAGPYINLKDALDRIGAQVGDTITLSIYVRTMVESETPVRGNFTLYRAGNITTDYPRINDATGCYYSPYLTPGEWLRMSSTYTIGEAALESTNCRFEANTNDGMPYEFSAPMLTLGDTLHPWRPAPEDTEQPSDLVYASEGVDLGDTSGLATDAAARGYASDAQAAAEATASADATIKAGAAETAAKGYADAQVATRARTFATGWEYRQTADTAVVEGKAYYTRSGTDPDWEWTAVENPVDADIATYWELLPERPVPPYDPGDVWLQGDGGAILACTAAKAAGESFSEDDWTLASGYTDDAAAAVLEGGIEALRQADTALSGRIDSAAEASRNAIAALDGRVAAAEGSISGVSGRLVSLEDYVRVVGGDHLELGKAGSSVTASLENDRLAFLLLGQDAPVAYIAADEDGTGKLFVTQAVVVSELQFGHGKWAWTERKNGNMALKWRGGEA